ncbi:D(2) dopamine receptor-like [Patiria miniata]|uniref:G-protein coupled receptors family 1 profile domain-containing protein n=1 Tax=Patiria miniata TaxID=46514 RepID=A0A914AB17_PATMI|nr:D(2) dopamine receptor-like [Patiria miniata]
MSAPPLSNCSFCHGNDTQSSPCNTVGDGLHIAFCLLVMLLGIPGNCLILRVYWSKPRKTSTNILIMALAWADLFSCVLLVHAIITNCVFGIGEAPAPLAILRYFLMCAVTVSVNVTSLIAFDRYDCVCRSNSRLFTTRRAIIVVVVVIIYTLTGLCMYFAVLIRPGLNIIPSIMLLLQIIGYLIAAVMIVVCYGKVYQTIRHHVKVGVGATREEPTGQGIRLTQTKMSSVIPKSCGATGASGTSPGSSKPDAVERQPYRDMSTHATAPGPSSSPYNGVRMEGSNGGWSEPIKTIARPMSNPMAPSRCENAKRGHQNPNMPLSILQRKTTRMLLVTSVVFLLSWVPYWIYVASLLASLLGNQLSPLGAFVVEKCAYLVYVNNAVNPLIYGLANRRFRKDSTEVLQQLRLC